MCGVCWLGLRDDEGGRGEGGGGDGDVDDGGCFVGFNEEASPLLSIPVSIYHSTSLLGSEGIYSS